MIVFSFQLKVIQKTLFSSDYVTELSSFTGDNIEIEIIDKIISNEKYSLTLDLMKNNLEHLIIISEVTVKIGNLSFASNIFPLHP